MTPVQISKLRRVVVGLMGAADAYERYARGWKERGPSDPFKKTRVKDFNKLAELGKSLLAEVEKQ
jgi:hypothetical protein